MEARFEALIGRTLAGHRIERLLGSGGMGAAFLARDANGQAAVVKVLRPELTSDRRLRERFVREGRALAKIPASPHVVKVKGACEEQGLMMVVMEYVEGAPLKGLIQRAGRLDPAAATRIAIDVARGLEVVHAQHLVHRDIKPDNVLVSPSGRATIVDFGVAKDALRTALTVPGQLLGTANYMSPEQWAGDVLDARCDVFGLGATLYHALVGAPPFEGEDLADLADQAESGDFPWPRDVVPTLPEELEWSVVRMLMPERDYRHGSARECALDLEGVLAGAPARIPCLSTPAGKRHALIPEQRYTIGREQGCQILIDDGSVSRRHAQIRRDSSGYSVCDLNSTLGTFVGDEAVTGPRPLRDGDALRVGGVTLAFSDPRGR